MTPAPQHTTANEGEINGNNNNDTSICSLKQPSLRQITSSHTSRSNNNKKLQRQGSTDIRKSQDPNASITLSRILLETSMQQSERGGGGGIGNNNNPTQSSKEMLKIKNYSSHVVEKNQHTSLAPNFQKIKSSNDTTNYDQQNEIMSYQSMNSGKVFSELNPSGL